MRLEASGTCPWCDEHVPAGDDAALAAHLALSCAGRPRESIMRWELWQDAQRSYAGGNLSPESLFEAMLAGSSLK